MMTTSNLTRKPFSVLPIQTEIFRPWDKLAEFIVNSVPSDLVCENMTIAVTSKIVSLAEGRLVNKSLYSKVDLVQREADVYLGEIGHGCHLTVKSGLLMASAGIDESNSETNEFILYPKNPFLSATNLWRDLKNIWKIDRLGVILTDSHTTPLRRGVTGVCLSYAGFQAVRSLIGTPDLFGRPLKMTQMNLADGLAASAVMVMGEGSERRPIAVLQNAPIEFTDSWQVEEFQIPLEEDLYSPLFKSLSVQSAAPV